MKTKQGIIYIADDGLEYTTEQALHYANMLYYVRREYNRIQVKNNGASPNIFNIPEILNSPNLIPAARAYLEYAKLEWPEEFNKT